MLGQLGDVYWCGGVAFVRRDLYYCFGIFLSVLFGVFSLTHGVVSLVVLYINLLNYLVDL